MISGLTGVQVSTQACARYHILWLPIGQNLSPIFLHYYGVIPTHTEYAAMMKTLTLTTHEEMQRYIDQVWPLLVEAYAKVSGGLHYANTQAVLEETSRWRVVLRHGRVIAVTLFKARRGWKLVAMALCRRSGERARHALRRLISADLSRCWMELSERAERFVLEHCGGQHFLIHASLAAGLLGKPVLPCESDGFHYRRVVAGVMKAKVVVGTPL